VGRALSSGYRRLLIAWRTTDDAPVRNISQRCLTARSRTDIGCSGQRYTRLLSRPAAGRLSAAPRRVGGCWHISPPAAVGHAGLVVPLQAAA